MKATIYKSIATLGLAAAAGIETVHFINGVPWNMMTATAHYFSIPLVLSWLAAIAGLWTDRGFSKPTLVLGTVLLLTHAIVLSAGDLGFSVGVVYLLCVVLAGVGSALAHSTYYTGQRKEVVVADMPVRRRVA